ncbi:MAG TPA: SPW repeat protein [Tepidisphaeraceae bacterium]
MNLIPTRVHGMLDYAVGLILIVAPWLIGFNDNAPATWVPFTLGCSAILYSLMTDYELGAFRVLPMGAHLAIDFCSGLLLLASPWLFGFADRIVWPHVTFGLLEIGVVLLSQRVPAHGASRHHDRLAM